MHSIQVYLYDTYSFSDKGAITHSDRDGRGHFIVLNRTIFYPQGGGQPSDLGCISTANLKIPINSVRTNDSEIRHYTDKDYSDFIGKEVTLHIDKDRRILNSKLHTAGHLISNLIESRYPFCTAVKGHHFPGESYVEFRTQPSDAVRQLDLLVLNNKLQELIAQNFAVTNEYITYDEIASKCPNLPYAIPQKQLIRLVKIGLFNYQPCGGTHIQSLSELKGLQITKQKEKSDSIKIHYSI